MEKSRLPTPILEDHTEADSSPIFAFEVVLPKLHDHDGLR
jgi:hypothetical protein